MNYFWVLCNFNLKLEKIVILLLFDVKFSLYMLCYIWVILVFYVGVNIGIICKVLGYFFIKVIEIYLKLFENEKVDIVNDELIILVVVYNGEKEVVWGILYDSYLNKRRIIY